MIFTAQTSMNLVFIFIKKKWFSFSLPGPFSIHYKLWTINRRASGPLWDSIGANHTSLPSFSFKIRCWTFGVRCSSVDNFHLYPFAFNHWPWYLDTWLSYERSFSVYPKKVPNNYILIIRWKYPPALFVTSKNDHK